MRLRWLVRVVPPFHVFIPRKQSAQANAASPYVAPQRSRVFPWKRSRNEKVTRAAFTGGGGRRVLDAAGAPPVPTGVNRRIAEGVAAQIRAVNMARANTIAVCAGGTGFATTIAFAERAPSVLARTSVSTNVAGDVAVFAKAVQCARTARCRETARAAAEQTYAHMDRRSTAAGPAVGSGSDGRRIHTDAHTVVDVGSADSAWGRKYASTHDDVASAGTAAGWTSAHIVASRGSAVSALPSRSSEQAGFAAGDSVRKSSSYETLRCQSLWMVLQIVLEEPMLRFSMAKFSVPRRLVRAGRGTVSISLDETRRCVHGTVRGQCRQCSSSRFCLHGRRRSLCPGCGGGATCPHGRQPSQCRQCGGDTRCEHGSRKHFCRHCGGRGICEHDRVRRLCSECAGADMCHHLRRRRTCRQCDGREICPHSRLQRQCKPCGGVDVCPHGTIVHRCRACGGSRKRQSGGRRERRRHVVCEHNRRLAQCRHCVGQGNCEHSRRRRDCWDCGGDDVCVHRRSRRQCRKCIVSPPVVQPSEA